MTSLETNGNGTAASVHLVLQGKGGVGKSFVSEFFRTKSAYQCTAWISGRNLHI
jgi:hypothetical protein